jgi:hypothetical protein
MSLKGYEFYDDNNETEAMFLFKYLYLYIYKPITEKRLNEIKSYLKEHNCDIIKTIETYKEQEDE